MVIHDLSGLSIEEGIVDLVLIIYDLWVGPPTFTMEIVYRYKKQI